jgi:putative two-component system response regulator
MDRLSNNCAKLAEAMQLSTTFGKLISDRYIKTIELASPLCDIGNISVPTNILQKTSELTVEEFETMKKHTTKGARLLSDVGDCADNNDFIEMAIEIANYHHEHWNGTGYPEGKVGEEIPLSAQIVGLVSVYCKPATPPAAIPPSGWNAFPFNYYGTAVTIYVPTNSVEAYKTADGWREYADAIVGYDF